MAINKEIDKNIEEVLKFMDTGKAIIGSDVTLKKLRTGKLAKIFLSATAPETIKNDIKHFAGISNVEIVELVYPSDEFGALCKKPFSISVIGILK
jgi:large subunit ribosomal protein L30e